MAKDVLAPHPTSARHPTDANQKHGQVYNAPRYPQMGGADKASKKGGPHKNTLSLRKPGGTR